MVSGGVAHKMELVTVATEAILVGLTPYSNYSVKVAIIVDESGDMGPCSYPTTIQTSEDGNFNLC